jgi:hypothetical protein
MLTILAIIPSASEIEFAMVFTRYNPPMKPDANYLKQLLTAFQGAPNPTTDIRELEGAGLSIDDPKFEFHMMLLQDGGFMESESRAGGIGLSKGADGSIQWSVIPLRLTASGHEFERLWRVVRYYKP